MNIYADSGFVVRLLVFSLIRYVYPCIQPSLSPSYGLLVVKSENAKFLAVTTRFFEDENKASRPLSQCGAQDMQADGARTHVLLTFAKCAVLGLQRGAL
jgi:hypothetical protein